MMGMQFPLINCLSGSSSNLVKKTVKFGLHSAGLQLSICN
jgi:hypothetical protein